MQRVIKFLKPRDHQQQLRLVWGCLASHFQGVPHCPLCHLSNALLGLDPFGPALILLHLWFYRTFSPTLVLSSVEDRAQLHYALCFYSQLKLGSPVLWLMGSGLCIPASNFSREWSIGEVFLWYLLTRGNVLIPKHGGLKLDLWKYLHDAYLDLFLGFGGWIEWIFCAFTSMRWLVISPYSHRKLSALKFRETRGLQAELCPLRTHLKCMELKGLTARA